MGEKALNRAHCLQCRMSAKVRKGETYALHLFAHETPKIDVLYNKLPLESDRVEA